jgi:hypothetical protein
VDAGEGEVDRVLAGQVEREGDPAVRRQVVLGRRRDGGVLGERVVPEQAEPATGGLEPGDALRQVTALLPTQVAVEPGRALEVGDAEGRIDIPG